MSPNRSAQQPLGAVTLHRFTNRFSGNYPEARFFELVWQRDQHDKRVGKGFSNSPHPLEVGRPGQAKAALYQSGSLYRKGSVHAHAPGEGCSAVFSTAHQLFQLILLT